MLARQIGKRTDGGEDGVPYLVETEEESVDATPKDEIERGSMPESTQEHRHEEIEVLTDFSVAIASKRDVEVVLEPRGEANVPTAPKLSNGLGLVGAVKVLGELESEQEGNTDGHVRIA